MTGFQAYPPPPPPPPRKHRHLPRWVAIGGVAAIVGLIACCGAAAISGLNSAADGMAEPTAAVAPGSAAAPGSGAAPAARPSAVSEGRVGDGIEVTSADDVFTATVIKAEKLPGAELFNRPQRGVFLAVQVEVRSDKGDMTAFPYSWRFVSSDGQVYESTFATLDGKPAFIGGQIAAGQKTGGWVIFDVPGEMVSGGRVQLTVEKIFADNLQLYWVL